MCDVCFVIIFFSSLLHSWPQEGCALQLWHSPPLFFFFFFFFFFAVGVLKGKEQQIKMKPSMLFLLAYQNSNGFLFESFEKKKKKKYKRLDIRRRFKLPSKRDASINMSTILFIIRYIAQHGYFHYMKYITKTEV